MKKNFIITVIALLVLLLAGLGVNYLLSLHKISFDLQNEASSATIYSSSDKQVDTVSAGGSLLLKDGSYYAIPHGDESIAEDKIKFLVEGKDKTITINPSFTKDYLANLLASELPNIQESISSKYPDLYDDFTLQSGTLYSRGDWFGGLLAIKVSDIRDQRDPYRIVMHKKDGNWEVVRRPEYTLSSPRYKEVPVDILRQINQIAL